MDTKVIFLDVDGVLNNMRSYRQERAYDAPLDRAACVLLCSLVAETGAAVVLSSSWRTFSRDSLHHQALVRSGVLRTLHEDWRTPIPAYEHPTSVLLTKRRGDEIAEWLARHPEVGRYAIIDDEDGMLEQQRPFFVKTDFETGLLPLHVEAARRILTGASA